MQWIVGLNSLRLFAIILIVIYHYFSSFLPGGFIAVEIFFAISGFLIIGGLTREYAEKGKVKYFAFIKERIGRLFPSLLLCVLLMLTIALLANPNILTGLLGRSVAALTFSTNIFELATGGGYEDFISPNLFRHTWFLALEMQFYLLMPLVFLLVAGQFKKKRSGLKATAVAFGILGAASVALMVIFGGLIGATDRAYFALDTHMASFCFGAMLGIINYLCPRKGCHSKLLPSLGIAAILATVAILSYKVSYANPISFYLILPLTGILSIILIFCVLQLQTGKKPRGLLKVLEYLGGATFGIYLFHYPLFLLAGYILPPTTPFWAYPTIAIIASLLLTEVCARVLKHIKKLNFIRKRGELRKRDIFTYVVYGFLFAVLIGASAYRVVTVPATSNISEQLASQVTSVNIETPSFFEADPLAQDAYNLLRAGLSVAENNAPVPAPETPKPTATVSVIPSDMTVLLIGDSVMLGAKANLESKIVKSYVDAVGSRGIEAAPGIISNIRSQGKLPEVIVVSLITNYRNVTAQSFDNIMNAAGPGHKFIFVTGYCGPTYSRDAQNTVLKNYVNSHDNAWLADWHAIASNDWSLMYSDHIHLNPAGREAFANMIVNVLREMQ